MQPSDRNSLLWSPAGRIIPLIVLGLLWQAASSFALIDPAFLPSPARVGTAIYDLLAGREIRDNLFITLWRAGLGLALGSIAGIWLGLMMARSPVFRAYATPIVGGTYSLPKSALIPLFILAGFRHRRHHFGLRGVPGLPAADGRSTRRRASASAPRALVAGRGSLRPPRRAPCCRRGSICRTRCPIFSLGCASRSDFPLCYAISAEMKSPSTNGIPAS